MLATAAIGIQPRTVSAFIAFVAADLFIKTFELA